MIAAVRGLGETPTPPALGELRAAAVALLASHEAHETTREARDERVTAQRAPLLDRGCPILQVHRGILCAARIGDLDAVRAARLSQELLTLAAARKVRTVIIDLTGAAIRDASTAGHLGAMLVALRLIGVRGMLCGLRPALARTLSDAADVELGATCFLDLAGALAACAVGPERAGGRPT